MTQQHESTTTDSDESVRAAEGEDAPPVTPIGRCDQCGSTARRTRRQPCGTVLCYSMWSDVETCEQVHTCRRCSGVAGRNLRDRLAERRRSYVRAGRPLYIYALLSMSAWSMKYILEPVEPGGPDGEFVTQVEWQSAAAAYASEPPSWQRRYLSPAGQALAVTRRLSGQ